MVATELWRNLDELVPLKERGIIASRAGGGCSKLALSAAMAAFLEASLDDSVVTDLGYSLLTIGGGVERFLALGFSKFAANALKAGDLPLTRTRSGLNDTLLDRCAFSGTLLDLPPYITGALRFGF